MAVIVRHSCKIAVALAAALILAILQLIRDDGIQSRERAGLQQQLSVASESSTWVAPPVCGALGIARILREPMSTSTSKPMSRAGKDLPWRLGHYPYRTCRWRHKPENSTAAAWQVKPTVSLLVVSAAYVDLLPGWAAQAHAAHVPCAVGPIGESTSLCQTAKVSGCSCLDGTTSSWRQRAPSSNAAASASARSDDLLAAESWSSSSDRSLAVRLRFAFALQLMQRGHAVLMHDADVFTAAARAGGTNGVRKLIDVAQQAAAIGDGRDFVVADNGQWRQVNFDALNWGVVWMSGSERCVHLLRCLLAAWDHPAFAEPDPPISAEKSYWRRSQPRINHLVELSMANDASIIEVAGKRGDDDGSPPAAYITTRADTTPPILSLCMFPPHLPSHAYTHLTGLSTPQQKITCARATGLLALPEDLERSQRTLSYQIPPGASPIRQWGALIEAFSIARRLNRSLRLPRAYSGNELITICQLVDVRELPPFTSPRAAPDGCASGRALDSGEASSTLAAWAPHLCVSFAALARSHDWQWAVDEDEPIRVCDPNASHVRKRHACEHVHDWIPRPRPVFLVGYASSSECPSLRLLMATPQSTRQGLWDDEGCVDGCIISPCAGNTGMPCCVRRQQLTWVGNATVWKGSEGTWEMRPGMTRRTAPWWECAGREVVDARRLRAHFGGLRLQRVWRQAAACGAVVKEVVLATVQRLLSRQPAPNLNHRLYGTRISS